MKKIKPPTILFLLIILQLILHFVFPFYELPKQLFIPLGISLVSFGLIINLWTDQLFKKGKTTVQPSEEPTAFVQKGPFKFSRNPMYLGMLLILLGTAAIVSAVSSFLSPILFFFIINKQFISREEQKMEKIFGEKFIEYKKKVRRWI